MVLLVLVLLRYNPGTMRGLQLGHHEATEGHGTVPISGGGCELAGGSGGAIALHAMCCRRCGHQLVALGRGRRDLVRLAKCLLLVRLLLWFLLWL